MFRGVRGGWERGVTQASCVYSDYSFKYKQAKEFWLQKVKYYRLYHKVWM